MNDKDLEALWAAIHATPGRLPPRVERELGGAVKRLAPHDYWRIRYEQLPPEEKRSRWALSNAERVSTEAKREAERARQRAVSARRRGVSGRKGVETMEQRERRLARQREYDRRPDRLAAGAARKRERRALNPPTEQEREANRQRVAAYRAARRSPN